MHSCLSQRSRRDVPSTRKPQANKRRERPQRGGEYLRCTVCLTNRGQARYIAPVCQQVEIAGKEILVFIPGSLPVVMIVFDVAWARETGPGRQRRRIA